jgi:hypothetical protein
MAQNPVATACESPSNERWTVPLGRLPVNTQLSAYYNVVHPDSGPTWQIRFQVQLLFPK